MSAVLPLPLTMSVARTSRDAIARAVRLGLESLRARPPMRLSDWAREHFILAGESSHQRGGWEPWPFQVGIMDFMSDDDIEELDVFKAKRIGYTKMLTASIGFDAAWRRRNQAVWQPTDDDRDSFVKTEVDPMIDGVPAVQQARRMTRGAEDTIRYKQFRDSVLHLLGGKAARAFRRITAAVVKLDELDGFDRQIEKSADAWTLAWGRLEGAPFPKGICGSTPRLKGLSNIEDRAELADADMEYHITCIHCGVEHPLVWGGKQVAYGFKWDPADLASVRHLCPHCREAITQADYLRNWVGAWVCRKTGVRYGADQQWRNAEGQPIKAPRHVAVRPWAAYSPQREWPDIVRQFLGAHAKLKTGERGPMQGFVNETLGRTFADVVDQADEHALARRAEAYSLRTVPLGGLVLVAGVDVQDNRFEIVVWAIGRGEEMWVVDYAVIPANPADERDWEDKLDPYLATRFPHAAGNVLGIEAAAVDTGGHFTHQAYNFCRTREYRRIFAIQGDNQPGKPIAGRSAMQDVNWRGKVLKRGVRLWRVGTDTAKDLVYGRLMVTQPGPGYVHFSDQLPPAFFSGLTAEARVPVRTAGGEQYRWVNTLRKRNEPLDCTVYAVFSTHRLGLHTYTDKMWDRLEVAVQPANADLFAAPPAPAPAPAPAVDVERVPAELLVQSSPPRARQPRGAFSREW
ncbi:phage terminase large subunit family protein [Methylibium sp.]|uniref:phage terminase large subunit family protein n=1 Tax=Methylibium sp. TaxID=2067992 RepID=UPI003BA94413